MKLKVKVKNTIVAEAKGGKNPPSFEIQKVGPYWIEFPLSEVRAFTDNDIKYILSTLPEYVEMMYGISQYMKSLEGNKADVLDRIKSKSHKFVDVDVLNYKIRQTTKIKHYIEYTESMPDGDDRYWTNIAYYDPADNNLS